jgi:hypothetical protein
MSSTFQRRDDRFYGEEHRRGIAVQEPFADDGQALEAKFS